MRLAQNIELNRQLIENDAPEFPLSKQYNAVESAYILLVDDPRKQSRTFLTCGSAEYSM